VRDNVEEGPQRWLYLFEIVAGHPESAWQMLEVQHRHGAPW
jgi:hypothetical protein